MFPMLDQLLRAQMSRLEPEIDDAADAELEALWPQLFGVLKARQPRRSKLKISTSNVLAAISDMADKPDGTFGLLQPDRTRERWYQRGVPVVGFLSRGDEIIARIGAGSSYNNRFVTAAVFAEFRQREQDNLRQCVATWASSRFAVAIARERARLAGVHPQNGRWRCYRTA